MPEKSGSRERELIDQGWTKQFSASGPRLREAAELYESTGLEVHLEPVRVEDLGCSECFQGPATAPGDWYVIYTRPRKEAPGAKKQDNDLW